MIGIIGKTHGVKRARKPMLIARTRNELILLSAIARMESLSKSKFSKTKSISFIKETLGRKLGPKFIFVSNNFKFGNKRNYRL